MYVLTYVRKNVISKNKVLGDWEMDIILSILKKWDKTQGDNY